MKLYEGIKEIIAKHGVEIVSTKQFVNVLDDIGAFKEEPAASKRVMKGILDGGFGDLLCQLTVNKDSNWQNKVRKSVSDYISKSGYKDDLVNSISAQLLYALGLINELPKASTSKSSSLGSSTEYKPRIKDPKELLFALKQEYQNLLQELITLTTDEFGHKYGYYTTEANTRLYVVASKLKIVAKETGNTEIDAWIKSEKDKVETKNRPTTAQIKQALNDQMASLEREYQSLLEKSYVVEDDEFGLKSARFNTNALADLKAIEDKIIAIGRRIKDDPQSWIDKTNKTKSDFLASKSSPATARNGVLDQLKNEYRNRLSELDKSTKSGEIDFNDDELKEIRRKLINLGSLLGKNMEEWCNIENTTISTNRSLRAAKRKKRNIIISAVAGLALLIGGGQTISYTSSADARAAYETTMSQADAEFAKGDYVAALDLYQKAENNYDALYSSSDYKGKAHDKAAEATAKILSDWQEEVQVLLKSNKVAQAKALTLALPQNLVFSGNSEETYKNLCTQIDSDLERRTQTMVDDMLNDIYTNHGKLSAAAKEELEQMIAVVPDNYWLNFIKEKAK